MRILITILFAISFSTYAGDFYRSGQRAHRSQKRAAMMGKIIGNGLIHKGFKFIRKGRGCGSGSLIRAGMTMVGMGLLSLNTANNMSQSSGKSLQAANAANNGPVNKGITPNMVEGQSLNTDSNNPSQNRSFDQKSKSIMQSLVQDGFKINSLTSSIASPSGEVLGPKDYSVKALLNAGVEKKVVGEVSSFLKKLESNDTSKYVEVAKSTTIKKSTKDEFQEAGKLTPPTASAPDDEVAPEPPPLKVSGLSKPYGRNDRIAVSGDSLFDLVSKRYKELNHTIYFIIETEQVAVHKVKK